MPYYLSGYDTESIFPWWEFMDAAGKDLTYQQMVSYEDERLREVVDGVRVLAEVHLRHNCPATWFFVGQLVEAAGANPVPSV